MLRNSLPFAFAGAWCTGLVLTIGLLALLSSPLSAKGSVSEKENAIAVYGGWLTSNDWQEVFLPARLDFVDSYLLALAVSREVARPSDKTKIELEGQIVRHFDIQDHWEFNALGVIRWTHFPWDEQLDMSAAGGLGLSYATELPEAELDFEGETERLLVYWMLELEAAIPSTDAWSMIARLHHRSPAYGLLGDGGGSNVVGLGLRYHF
ncbi:MAG: hypothetical protein ACR2QF_04625 [Geminicoccaceae bacterium]